MVKRVLIYASQEMISLDILIVMTRAGRSVILDGEESCAEKVGRIKNEWMDGE